MAHNEGSEQEEATKASQYFSFGGSLDFDGPSSTSELPCPVTFVNQITVSEPESDADGQGKVWTGQGGAGNVTLGWWIDKIIIFLANTKVPKSINKGGSGCSSAEDKDQS